jgi:hypothetical protein
VVLLSETRGTTGVVILSVGVIELGTFSVAVGEDTDDVLSHSWNVLSSSLSLSAETCCVLIVCVIQNQAGVILSVDTRYAKFNPKNMNIPHIIMSFRAVFLISIVFILVLIKDNIECIDKIF